MPVTFKWKSWKRFNLFDLLNEYARAKRKRALKNHIESIAVEGKLKWTTERVLVGWGVGIFDLVKMKIEWRRFFSLSREKFAIEMGLTFCTFFLSLFFLEKKTYKRNSPRVLFCQRSQWFLNSKETIFYY